MADLDAREVWNTLQGLGHAVSPEPQAYRHGVLAGNHVILGHPSRLDDDGNPSPTRVQADQIEAYLAKGFTLPPIPEEEAEAKRTRLEAELDELSEQAKRRMAELDALDDSAGVAMIPPVPGEEPPAPGENEPPPADNDHVAGSALRLPQPDEAPESPEEAPESPEEDEKPSRSGGRRK